MNLKQILANIKQPFEIFGNPINASQINIDDISLDSRKVKKNTIFFGIIGAKNDGANYLEEVSQKGCVVAVISNQTKFDYQNFIIKNPQNIIIVGNCHELLQEILNIYYNSLPKNIYAVTGTNGKTSTVEFIRQILEFINIKSASIGTLGVKANIYCGDNFADSGLTTPDIVSLYKNLSLLKNHAIDDVAIEVSSIGLEQGRVGGLDIEIGAFTNFTQDHLDYHGDMTKYFACKMILFKKVVLNQGFAVVNADITEFQDIQKICQNRKIKIFDYGFKAEILKILKINRGDVSFRFDNNVYNFSTNLKGDFQVYNILCALGCVLSKYQLNHQQINQLLLRFSELNPAVGRMQLVGEVRGAKIFIDFAHTPDALENVLKLTRQIAKNRVIILFGCGGDRDNKKRPIMGEIASNLADLIIITDDNPRTEKPEIIRRQIIDNCTISKTTEIGDRKKAIAKAIEILQDGDVLVIAGKGHENYQIIGSQKFEFNEEQIVKDVIKQLS